MLVCLLGGEAGGSEGQEVLGSLVGQEDQPAGPTYGPSQAPGAIVLSGVQPGTCWACALGSNCHLNGDNSPSPECGAQCGRVRPTLNTGDA